jgi:hypothetical protein
MEILALQILFHLAAVVAQVLLVALLPVVQGVPVGQEH